MFLKLPGQIAKLKLLCPRKVGLATKKKLLPVAITKLLMRLLKIAQFSDFVSFVHAEFEEANSVFGLRSFGTKNPHLKVKTSSFNMNVSAKGKNSKPHNIASDAWWFCKQKSHILAEYQKFWAEPVKKRFGFVKSFKPCHKSFRPKHRTPKCKRKKPCEKSDCAKPFHDTLLHFPKSESKGKVLLWMWAYLRRNLERWEPFPQHESITFRA